MFKLISTGILATSLSVVTGTAQADPKPDGARTPSPASIEKIYSGKTVRWSGDCKGGIYLDAQSTAQSYCRKGNGSIGLGKWMVNRKASVCYEMTYYWPDGDSVGSKNVDRECMNHVVDSKGRLWVNWDGQSDWWPVTNERLVNGFEFKRPVSQMRGQLGV